MDSRWDNMESYRLRECYKLAERFERDDAAREFLRARADTIDLPENYIPAGSAGRSAQSVQESFSRVLEKLASEPVLTVGPADYWYIVSSMPPSAEKEYLSAIFALRGKSDERARGDAMAHLNLALGFSPDDPRLRILSEILTGSVR